MSAAARLAALKAVAEAALVGVSKEPREWVIRKGGYYYRPDKAGYTSEECAAGRYTEAEAKAEARIEPHHMFALHLPWKPCNPIAAAELATLRAEVKRLRALLRRYRDETPLGHQPHMIAGEADAALGRRL